MHVVPSPVNPVLQLHVNDPIVLVQFPFVPSQLLKDGTAHSSISK